MNRAIPPILSSEAARLLDPALNQDRGSFMDKEPCADSSGRTLRLTPRSAAQAKPSEVQDAWCSVNRSGVGWARTSLPVPWPRTLKTIWLAQRALCGST